MAPQKYLDKTAIHDRFMIVNPSWRCHMAIPIQDLKRCSKCGEEKTYDEFYRKHSFNAKRKVTSVMAECKVCTRKRSKDRKNGVNREQIMAQDNAAFREKRKRVRDEAFAAYGGYTCVCCGETEPSFMTLDHIENDGADFRRKIKGKRTAAGYHTYTWLSKNGYPKTVQVLCMNCNFGKRMNKGTCPHQVRSNDYPVMGVGPSGPKRTAPHLAIARG
jgi:hypothetical protein